MSDFLGGAVALVILASLVLGGLFGISFLYRNYQVWSQEMQGRAELARAEWNKQIITEEARAQNEAATLQAEARIKQETANAEAEIIRARGLAEANEIIGASLKGNDDYLRYLWIQQTHGQQVIYIPTEAGLPILEAGKRP